jgi:uncharacterized protein YcbK (DUF882 family)
MTEETKRQDKKVFGRRDFITTSIAAAMSSLAAAPVRANQGNSRYLRLYNPNRLESLSIQYCVDGWYNPDALGRINHFMRDPQTNETVNIDPHLLDILYQLQQHTSPNRFLNILSGYRSAVTNAWMAQRSRDVARNSFHMYGRAADLHLPGYSLHALHEIAVSLNAGGVGYYPRSDFIHVDTGPIRAWGDDSSYSDHTKGSWLSRLSRHDLFAKILGHDYQY